MAMLILSVVISSIIAYLLGSINFALVISKVFYKKDIRKYGSGNAGMTNMLRTFGKLPALGTLIGDFSKGIVSILIAKLILYLLTGSPNCLTGYYIVGICAFLGHIFPIYYGFKGGKGILVSAGIILIIDPLSLGIVFLVFLLVFLCSRIISLSSICSATSYPVATCILRLLQGTDPLTIVLHTFFALVIAVVVIWLHRGNIKRLLAGEEPKIGQKLKSKK